MDTKILVIGVIKKGHQILLRKKPDGSPPYKETWYLLHGELKENQTPEDALSRAVKQQVGIDVKPLECLGWDYEIKKDHDERTKRFIYLDMLCEYLSGDLKLSPGIERLEWVDIEKLNEYDLVPPTRKLFNKLGYLPK